MRKGHLATTIGTIFLFFSASPKKTDCNLSNNYPKSRQYREGKRVNRLLIIFYEMLVTSSRVVSLMVLGPTPIANKRMPLFRMRAPINKESVTGNINI
jgi:hypothetical protein